MSSTIPDVIDALTTLFTDVLPEKFQVVEGSAETSEPDFLIVAMDDDSDSEAVAGERGVGDVGRRRDGEVYDIRCLLSCWTGEADVRGIRRTLFDLFDQLDDALVANQKLGVRNVMSASIADFGLMNPITDAGAVATIRFTVHVDAFR